MPLLLGAVRASSPSTSGSPIRCEATEELLDEALFGERPAAEALIAERGGEPVGYALFFPTFSTFLAIQGIWLEDLFVRPAAPQGAASAGRCWRPSPRVLRERGGERLEWSALDWNELALGFYRGLGAQRMDEWITHRLDRRGRCARLAAESPARRRRARAASLRPGASATRRALVVQWIRRPPPKR